ncbi:MAG: 1-deoxy-D-xylulose-5-phosphate synthase [Lachnospiraceae bacterium]
MILEKINQANDIKNLNKNELQSLAQEIREFLIQKISVSGGHLASNLGVVELTIALHLALDLPKDKIVWDVGHQSYTHKLLTGRKEGFDHLRKHTGMSGFPKRKESDCDCFDTGHSSTSISAGLGYAQARQITGDDYTVVSVIGDGAMTGGMAFEALNNASSIRSNFMIVLNDNNMSISENVGGLSKLLSNLRMTKTYQEIKTGVANTLGKVPIFGDGIVDRIRRTKSGLKQLLVSGMYFENMGITYLGPVDGHDVPALVKIFKEASQFQGPVLVHVITQKGRGYLPAEKHPSRFHGTDSFDIATGIPLKTKQKPGYTDVFSNSIVKIGKQDERVVGITAAMADGTGLKRFSSEFPERFFDVGIAEEHAVTFAAGLAAAGLRPVVCIYSSFLQRAYDQILHDVCIQNLPVVFAVDRAGLVGSDGETHQGIFDLSFLSSIPNMTIMAPKNKWELTDMLNYAVNFDGPVAIRYPRGEAYDGLKDFKAPILLGKSEILYDEFDIALIAVGSMVHTAESVRNQLRSMGYHCSLINARFVKPIDTQMLMKASDEHNIIVTLEENVINGGFGEHVAEFLTTYKRNNHLIRIAISDEYVEHGNVDILRREVGIDPECIVKKIITEHISIKPYDMEDE